MMTHALMQELADERTRMMSLTTEQYHQMLDAGILVSGDPYELLDGLLVHKDRSQAGDDAMTVGSHHAFSVQRLASLDAMLRPLGCFMRTQNPVTFPPDQEPEPDGSIAIGKPEDYRNHHPGASDLTSIIEVADASLRRDRTTKLRVYAQAGIAQYIIINLIDRTIEEYTDPIVAEGRYGRMQPVDHNGTVEFHCPGDRRLAVKAADLLP